MKVGDRVSVDLTGMFVGICGTCGAVTLAVPEGACAHCHAPADGIVRDPDPRSS